MTEKVAITINNLDDFKGVTIALDNLFKRIFAHYVSRNDMNTAIKFVMTCAVYFGVILNELGYNADDLKEF